MNHPTLRVALGADHGAFDLKNAVATHLKSSGYEIHDFGTHTPEAVDYADYANVVARNVADGTYDFGILACTSGVGMSIAANRHRHVRAANVRAVEETVITRRHNDANVLCLSGKYTPTATALAMVDAFLTTAYEGGRHDVRVCKSSGSRLAVGTLPRWKSNECRWRCLPMASKFRSIKSASRLRTIKSSSGPWEPLAIPITMLRWATANILHVCANQASISVIKQIGFCEESFASD